MSCGVYKITNQINGKCYIGQSINIEQRWREERTAASSSTDSEYNTPRSRAIRKYGLENFTFEVLEECEVENLNLLEQFYAEYYNSYVPNGYNIAICGEQGFSFRKLNLALLKEIISDLKETDISEKELAIKYNVSLDNISKINLGKRCRLPNEDYPIRKRNLLPKDKVICPFCGGFMDRHAKMCINCRNLAKKIISDESIKEVFPIIYKDGFEAAGRVLGISGNAIKKRLKKMNIPHLIKDFRAWFQAKTHEGLC